MRIGIITPVYRAWERVKQNMDAIDKNTVNAFVHILVDDASPDTPDWFSPNASYDRRRFFTVPDDVPADQHTARITKMLQFGADKVMNTDFDFLFVVESDVMVPPGWDQAMIDLTKCFEFQDHPIGWTSLEAFAVNEQGEPEYPMNVNHAIGTYRLETPTSTPEKREFHHFQITRYNDWNCILFNPKALRAGWRFDDVPSHHDILLSRKMQLLTGWPHFRTQEVNVIHYPNSSRDLLPKR